MEERNGNICGLGICDAAIKIKRAREMTDLEGGREDNMKMERNRKRDTKS